MIIPTRVVTDADGSATTPERALRDCKTSYDIVFIRDDGWSLGASFDLERIAYHLWPLEWTHFAFKEDDEPKPISLYRDNYMSRIGR